MAQHLNCAFISRYLLATAYACMATASGAAITQDPTQPPLTMAAPGSSGSRANTPPSSTIQSITRRGGQHYAMINGETVKAGDTVSEGRIVQITDNAVIIRSTAGLTTLKIFPDVDKRLHTHTKPARQPSVNRN